MFIYNLRVNKNCFFKISIIVMIIIVLIILFVIIYNIFFIPSKFNICTGNNNIIEITSNNYTNILKTVNENPDDYIGRKIHFTGYVYRLIDFEEDEFVLARDMLISNNNQALVVGFLCSFKDASKFDDGTWVEIKGEITKKNYHGEIAMVKVTDMFEIQKPENEYVNIPDDTYILTNK